MDKIRSWIEAADCSDGGAHRPVLMTYRVAAITAGNASPSARFRVRQHITELLARGISVTEFSPGWRGRARNQSGLATVLNCVAATGRNLANALESRKCDATLIQRWAFSGLPTTERISGRPRVWDVDDAIWLRLPDFIVRRHAALFDRIICGNSFLAQELEKWNRRVVIVPTAVDTDRFVPAQQRPVVRSICWTGSSSNLKYLYQVGGAIAVVLAKYPDVRLRIICDAPPVCPDLDPRRVDYIPWSETGELKVEGATIGIMPLDDTLWSRGKCSYKMLCYMACGIPVVASPVGMNAEVLGMDAVGIGASGPHEWVDGLSSLLNSPTESDRLGRNGRRLAVSRFSVGAIAPTLASELKSLF